MEDILVPIFVCVVLPVAIVLIVFLTAMNSDNKRAQVLIKAIEANCGIDADKLAEALRKPQKTPREILNMRLLRGCIFSLIGLFLIIMGIVSIVSGYYFSYKSVNCLMIFGGAAMAIGISYLIVFLATRKQVEKDEEK